MKDILLPIFFLLIFINFCTGQEIDKEDENTIFLICRGTKSKQNIVAKDFNLKDTLITHMGVGFIKGKELIIYNVSNFKKNEKGSALISESYNSFINLSDITYSAIWKFKSNEKELVKLKTILEEYSKTRIQFDNVFVLDETNDYYCSEFIYNVLKKVNINKFDYIPVRKKLSPFYSNALHRKEFVYIPVDFFLSFNLFEKVYEKKHQ